MLKTKTTKKQQKRKKRKKDKKEGVSPPYFVGSEPP
jgi:hypothetical protein